MKKQDRNIRTFWLIGLMLSLINSLAHFLYQLKYATDDFLLSHFRPAILALSVVAIFGFTLLFYHCAYKKPGTKLLLLSLIVNGFFLLFNPIAHLTGVLPLPPYITHPNLYLIFNTSLGLAWFLLCWRMRQLNQKLKNLAVTAHSS